MPSWYRSTKLSGHPQSAIGHIKCQFLALPWTRWWRPVADSSVLGLRPRRRPAVISERLESFWELRTYRLFIERPNECVSVAIFCSGNRGLGFDDRVNATHWMASVAQLFNGSGVTYLGWRLLWLSRTDSGSECLCFLQSQTLRFGRRYPRQVFSGWSDGW